MALFLRAALFVTVLSAFFGALPIGATDASDYLTCVYAVDALTSTDAYSQSHGGAYITFSNSAGENVTLHLVRPGAASSTEYTYLQGEHFNYVGTGSCVTDICQFTAYMDSAHEWKADYIVVSSGTETKWFESVPWITQEPISVDECSNSAITSKHLNKPRKVIRSVVSNS